MQRAPLTAKPQPRAWPNHQALLLESISHSMRHCLAAASQEQRRRTRAAAAACCSRCGCHSAARSRCQSCSEAVLLGGCCWLRSPALHMDWVAGAATHACVHAIVMRSQGMPCSSTRAGMLLLLLLARGPRRQRPARRERQRRLLLLLLGGARSLIRQHGQAQRAQRNCHSGPKQTI